MNHTISQVTENQLETLQHIAQKTFIDTFGHQNDEADMKVYLKEAFSLSNIKKEFYNPHSQFYFLRIDDQVAGYSKLNTKDAQSENKGDDNIEIERIYLEKSFQGKGLGKALMVHAIETAKEKGMNYIWLGVWEKNQKAIDFYKKFGFVIFDDHYFTLGKDVQRDLLMELRIG